MALPFSQNVSEAIVYTNTSLKKFSSWIILVTMTFLMLLGVAVSLFGVVIMTAAAVLMFLPEYFGPLADFVFSINDALVNLLGQFTSNLLSVGLVLTIVGAVVALLFSFWLSGVFVRGAAPGAFSIAHPWKLLGQGFMTFVISLVYCIPALIITILIYLGPMYNQIYFILVGIVLHAIVLIISFMAAYMGIAAYANTGKLSAAFRIGKVCSAVTKFGWLRLFGQFLLFTLLVCVVEVVLLLIPFLGWLLLLLLLPFIQILSGRFFGNAYRSI